MKAILQWVLKTMMKDQTGVMRTLPKKDLVDFNVAMTAERLARNGIDPNALKNANQVENAIRMIDDRPKVQEGITATKSAKVMDMKGKEIDPRSKIMGGTQSETEAEIAERLSRENKEGISRIRERQKMIDNAIDNQSPGFSGDRKVDAVLVAEEMAERMGKVYDNLPQEEQTKLYGEAFDALSKKEIAKSIEEGKKITPYDSETAAQIGKDIEEAGGMEEFLKKNPIDDDTGDFAQGGRAGFDNGGLLSMLDIKAEGSKSGKQQIPGAPSGITIDQESYNFVANLDIPISEKITLLTNIAKGKGRTKIEKDNQEIFLDEGGSKSRNIGAEFNRGGEGLGGRIMYNLETGKPQLDLRFTKPFADGGRAGFKIGGIDKARRAFLKTMGAAGAGITALKTGLLNLGKEAAPMVEAAKKTVTKVPDYFFDLVAKIKAFGKPGIPISERQNVTNYKNYELTEDVTTGDIRITKQKGDPDAAGYREEVMEYNKGGVPDEDVGITRESYDEATLFPDMDGKMKDIEDGIEPDSIKEIIEETIKEAPPIKKAGGGIARMLGE